jgi:aminoglycoside 2'-N-acetyltransferase I
MNTLAFCGRLSLGRSTGKSVSNHVEIVNGDEGWLLASPLLEAVWPPQVLATLPWRDVIWAHADHRVLSIEGRDAVIGHAGIYLRNGTLDGQPVKIGGIGGVATRLDYRRQGVATAVTSQAVAALMNSHGVDFGLLFCEPRHAPLYKRLGWHFFAGEVFVEQGHVRFSVIDPFVFDVTVTPRAGVLDVRRLPW